jgi:hypothetical protein
MDASGESPKGGFMPNRAENSAARKRGPNGRFGPGNKEGRGRPKGSRNKATVVVEALLDGEAEELTQTLIDRAKAGDVVALRLVFNRLAPVRKVRYIEVNLPPINTAEEVLVAQATVIQSVAVGELSLEEGHSFLQLLEIRRRTLEAAVEKEAGQDIFGPLFPKS